MYRIAVCDDEKCELDKINTLLSKYRSFNLDREFYVQYFSSIEELIAEMINSAHFDILLLDVYMKGKTGIEGAKYLRESGFNCPIIFLTVSQDHAIDAFGVYALQYLTKPLVQEEFYKALDKAFEQVLSERRRYITLRTKDGIQRIPIRSVLYCEAQKNYQCLYLADGVDLLARMTMSELHNHLSDFFDFVRLGSTYIINLSHVNSFTSKFLYLDNGKKLNIPRGAYAVFRERYFTFYCGKGAKL